MRISKTKNSGFSLIEVLVAGFVFATGILGIASLQLKSMGMLSNSDSMNVAMIAASDIVDRMHANSVAVFEGNYDSIDESVSEQTCTDSCSVMEIARQDVYSVYQQISGQLPDATLSVSNLGNNIFTVEITWTERIGTNSTTKRHRVSFLPYKP